MKTTRRERTLILTLRMRMRTMAIQVKPARNSINSSSVLKIEQAYQQ